MARPVTLFSWGYDGWGSSVGQLLEITKEAERQRGFDKPMFVDIRFRRSGRAPGFREHAFEERIGHERYRWFRSLGNRAFNRNRIEIECESSVRQLLDLAIDLRRENRRVIFFCHCPSPYDAGNCHRRRVAQLLRREADRVRVEEWPGGQPSRTTIAIRCHPRVIRAVESRFASVPLSRANALRLAALPWGSIIELDAGEQQTLIETGPPQARSGSWTLPVLAYSDVKAWLRKEAIRDRRRYGLDVA